LAFGGAGPLHAAALVDELGMKGVIIPPSPGNFSAIGDQLAQVRYDYVRTKLKSIYDTRIEEYNQLYKDMGKKAIEDLAKEGYKKDKMLLAGTADVRYGGQAWELSFPVPTELFSEKDLQRIIRTFHEIHERTYGYKLEDEDVVLVNLRLSALGRVPLLEFPRNSLGSDISKKAIKGNRNVFIKSQYEECPIYDRGRLTPGCLMKGPAIIEEYASTTLVLPEYVAKIDEFNNILIEKEE
jgi:N-methylhydantoinase A